MNSLKSSTLTIKEYNILNEYKGLLDNDVTCLLLKLDLLSLSFKLIFTLNHFIMKNLIVFILLGVFIIACSNEPKVPLSLDIKNNQPTDPELRTQGMDYDFTNLSIGESISIEMYDNSGTPFIFVVTKTSDNEIDVAADVDSLNGIEENTTVSFRDREGNIKVVNLTDVKNNRCGWLCVIAHICCVKIHIGPPGNTWDWDCSACTIGNNND